MYRHNPQTAQLVELVRSGAIGELRLVRAAFSYSLYDAREHPPASRGRRRRADGRRLLLRQRLAPARRASRRRVFGEAVASARAATDWVFAGLMRFPGDVLAQFDCGTALPERDELEAVGSEGSLFLDDPWHCRKPGIELRRDGGVERIELEPVDSYRLELREPRATRSAARAQPLLGREDALGQARAIEALFRSAELGRRSRRSALAERQLLDVVARDPPRAQLVELQAVDQERLAAPRGPRARGRCATGRGSVSGCEWKTASS